jgi:hypothetical protein
MNEKGRDILREAALAGKKQITGGYYRDGGACVVGMLHEALHHNQDKGCCVFSQTLRDELDISVEEFYKLVDMNDNLGYDFLAIANKL